MLKSLWLEEGSRGDGSNVIFYHIALLSFILELEIRKLL